MKQDSSPIVIRKDDPVGTDYIVDQPFTRLAPAEIVSGPASGSVGLYRISNHIGSFVRLSRGRAPVTILGRISQDPLVYDFKTVLPVTPSFIQYPAGGPFYKVEGGDLQVTLKPGISNYSMFARTAAYGYDVQIRGELSSARESANPGGFNPRRFMQNYNVFGLMSVFQAPGADSPVRAVVPAGGSLRHGNALVEFSLDLRDRMLRVLKLTLPYPHSAFLGGVTLGLRYGLQGALCMFSSQQRVGTGESLAESAAGTGEVHRDCEETIADEFKASGVNHVLAVSGLHVTIITLMFIGIFSLLRILRQVYVPVIILALVIFAIITGARPSVLRAVIMNSLFILTWAYLSQGLRASALLGVPVAAFLILLQNPLVVVDPSFTLSFGAILSLALLTGPAYEPLSRLRGNDFLFFLVIAVTTTLIGIFHWALLVTPSFLVLYGTCCVALWLAGHELEHRGIRLFGQIGYATIPASMGAFFAAQFAIQIGMMVPLSSYYFCRWPFAGAYANLIAIPLIGVVVQLGAIAGLIGMLPAVGIYVALILSAANWVFSSAFLWLAHASARAFPYPFVRKPSLGFLVTYYLFCAALIWHRAIWKHLKAWCEERGWKRRTVPVTILVALGVLAIVPAWLPHGTARQPGLHVTVLPLGYGSSILVETPGGKNILIDAGHVQHDRGRRNDAVRTVLPFLCHRGIRHLDGLILTSPHIERIAGASYVLDQTWVDELYLPRGMGALDLGTSMDEFLRALGGRAALDEYSPQSMHALYDEVVRNRSWPGRPSLARSLRSRGTTLANRWAKWVVNTRVANSGSDLFVEGEGEQAFRIEVLNPDSQTYGEFPLENNSTVLRIVYGRFALLITSDLHYKGQQELAEAYSAQQLKANVLLVPHRGAAVPAGDPDRFKANVQTALKKSLGPFLDKVNPQTAIFEFGNPRPVLGRASRDAENVHELTRQFVSDRLGVKGCLNTDSDFAIFIDSDGDGYSVHTQAEMNRAAGGAEDAVDDIAIGL